MDSGPTEVAEIAAVAEGCESSKFGSRCPGRRLLTVNSENGPALIAIATDCALLCRVRGTAGKIAFTYLHGFGSSSGSFTVCLKVLAVADRLASVWRATTVAVCDVGGRLP